MFNKLTLAFTFLVMFTMQGFSQTSYLQLSLFDDMDFSVVFDNTEFSAGNFAEFDNLSAGEHSLKVIKAGINVPPQANVIFDGKIKIPSGYDIYAVIDEFNAFMIYKKKVYQFNRLFPQGEYSQKCGESSSKINNKENIYDPKDECKYKAIKKDDFSDLKSTINNMNFESTNIGIVKTALDKNYFSSEQMREILKFFNFESNKLEIAKYSYSKICDKNNFFKLYDAFDYDSSIQELKNYISGK